MTNRDHKENDCAIPVSIELPCGHVKTNVPCFEYVSDPVSSSDSVSLAERPIRMEFSAMSTLMLAWRGAVMATVIM